GAAGAPRAAAPLCAGGARRGGCRGAARRLYNRQGRPRGEEGKRSAPSPFVLCPSVRRPLSCRVDRLDTPRRGPRTRMRLADLQKTLSDADPAAVLVPPRTLERIVTPAYALPA